MKDKFWLALLVALPLTSVAEPQRVEEFINNKLVDISVYEKRVVVTSESGINWCKDVVTDSKSWVGITGVVPASAVDPVFRDAILQTENEMLVQIENIDDEYRWLHYDFMNETFKIGSFSPAGLGSSSPHLYGSRGGVYGETFYCSVSQVGILTIENGSASGLLIPGVDHIAPVDTTFNEALDSNRASISVIIQDSLLYSLSKSSIYQYNLNSKKWVDTLLLDVSDTNLIYSSIEATSGGMLLYKGKKTTTDVAAYTFDMSALNETPLVSGDLIAIRENKNGDLYSLDLKTGITPRTHSGQVVQSIDDFSNRIENSSGFGGDYIVNDIAYGSYGTESVFAVATSIGLLYSIDEHGDEADAVPFNFFRKEIAISLGLDKVYAVPFIMNYEAGNEVSFFKYALEENANVSIDIFDYNMDFVCRIIDNQPRSSAKTTGQSGERGSDFWDGTFSNDGGNTVAPGVYFFRITTDRGEQGFGKIIVAKN